MGQKIKYDAWIKQVNPKYVSNDYDLEKAYEELPFETMEAWRKNPKNNHLPDVYKKPNHSTFSNESIYYDGQTPALGGYWKEDNYIQNPKIGPPQPPQNFNNGGNINNTGYLRDSVTKYNPYNIIPSSNITMEGVDFPVYGTDNLGNSQMMYPGNNYKFPGSYVIERPMNKFYQQGGFIPQEEDQSNIQVTDTQGEIAPISNNPYSPSPTYEISGPSHEQGGVQMNINNQDIEAEGGETIEGRADGSVTIVGNLKIPNKKVSDYLLSLAGFEPIKEGYNQKFKSRSKDIAEEEEKAIKVMVKKIAPNMGVSQFSQHYKVSQDSIKVQQDIAKHKMKELAQEKEKLATLQDLMHLVAEDFNIPVEEINEKKHQEKLANYKPALDNPITNKLKSPLAKYGGSFQSGGEIPVNVIPPQPELTEQDIQAYEQSANQSLNQSFGPQLGPEAFETLPQYDAIANRQFVKSPYQNTNYSNLFPQSETPTNPTNSTFGDLQIPKNYVNNKMVSETLNALKKYLPEISSAGIAGILGNIAQETDFDIKNLGSHNNGKSSARGLIGWINSNWKKIEPIIRQAGKNPNTIDGQAYGISKYLQSESPRAYKSLQSATDPRMAAQIFHDEIEKSNDKVDNVPGWNNRLNTASSFYMPGLTLNAENFKNLGITFRSQADIPHMNRDLMTDVATTAKRLGFNIGISSSKSDHKSNTKSGNTSRHSVYNAIDIATINGYTYKNNPTEFALLAEKFTKAMQELRYDWNIENGNPKAILYQTKDHYNHIHVSYEPKFNPPANSTQNTNQKKYGGTIKAEGGVTIYNRGGKQVYVDPRMYPYSEKYVQDAYNQGNIVLPPGATIEDQVQTTQTNDKNLYGALTYDQYNNWKNFNNWYKGSFDFNITGAIANEQQAYNDELKNYNQANNTNYPEYYTGDDYRSVDDKLGLNTYRQYRPINKINMEQNDIDALKYSGAVNQHPITGTPYFDEQYLNWFGPKYQQPIPYENNSQFPFYSPETPVKNEGEESFVIPTTPLQQVPSNTNIKAETIPIKPLQSPIQTQKDKEERIKPKIGDNIQGADLNRMLSMLPFLFEQPEYPPVQQYNPLLMDYTYFDNQADRNNVIAQLNATRRLAQSNPAALGAIQGSANLSIGQIDQNERNTNAQNRQQIYNANIQTSNQANLQNLQYAAIAQQQKDQAIANTRSRREAAIANYLEAVQQDKLNDTNRKNYNKLTPYYQIDNNGNIIRTDKNPTFYNNGVYTGGVENALLNLDYKTWASKQSKNKDTSKEAYYKAMQEAFKKQMEEKEEQKEDASSAISESRYGLTLKKFSKFK